MKKSKLDKFDIIYNDSLINFCPEIEFDIIEGREVLSVINDFSENKWQAQKFQNFIWNNIALTALSKKERDNLVDGSYTALIEAAKKLRLIDKTSKTKDTEGSELAEILLYGIMSHHYGAMPVVPKIFNKQNSQDNAKGADSVHLVSHEDDDFSIWYGEAKFYNSLEDLRLYKIVESVIKSIQKLSLNTENRIVANSNDLREYLKDKDKLLEKVLCLLDSETPLDYVKAKLNIPILLLHQCEITKEEKVNCDEYIVKVLNYQKDKVSSFYKKLCSKANKDDEKNKPIINFDKIKFHFIFFPVPDKSNIVNEFLSEVEHFKSKN